MPAQPVVAIRGRSDAPCIIVSTGDPDAAVAALREALSRQSRQFFGDAQLDLELQGPALDPDLAHRLAVVLREVGLSLRRIEARPAGRAKRPASAHLEGPQPSSAVPTALLRRGTVRGGQRLVHDGSVVIVGDVNPGAEVVATGSVIVWGRLRGKVEAGVGGDADAFVCALDLAPSQLRIGPVVARAPDEPQRLPEPEVATLRDGQIVVTAWR